MNSIKCQHCGWCCLTIPCPMGIYLTGDKTGPCSYLCFDKNKRSKCSLILNEQDELKKTALLELIVSGQGCSHKFGPHPNVLIQLALNNGLVVNSKEWHEIKFGMEQSINNMTEEVENSFHKEQLAKALREFADYCFCIE